MFHPNTRDGGAGAIGARQTFVWFRIYTMIEPSNNGKIGEMNIVACSRETDPSVGIAIIYGWVPNKCGVPHARTLDCDIMEILYVARNKVGAFRHPNAFTLELRILDTSN